MGAKATPVTPDLSAALVHARANTDALFELVRPESLYERPIPERHRIIFYVGHLEAFDWNLIGRGALDLPSFHPNFDKLFSFGIDPDSSELPRDRASDWPGPEEVYSYNARVRSTIDELLDKTPRELLHVAIEHRLMHAETFVYMLHNLEQHHKLPGPQPVAGEARAIAGKMVRIPGGPAILGARKDDGFGWDNEFEQHEVAVGEFSIGKYKVTNRQYLEFVEEGGPPPHFWSRESGRWFYRGMFGNVPLPPDWPVYVAHEQAAAYAAWKGKRLPTEAEFQRAAYGDRRPRIADRGSRIADRRSQVADRRPLDESAGDAGCDPDRDNFDFRSWDPIPVDASPENGNGTVQMVGNGWEWTSTVFGPFPGFRTFDFYPGYSAPFFDGRHFVLKGASPRTAAKLARPSFRNWFRGGYPYVYAAFRLAGE